MNAWLKSKDNYQESTGKTSHVWDDNISVKAASNTVVVSASCDDNNYPKDDVTNPPKTLPREIHRSLEIHLSARDLEKIVREAFLAGIIEIAAKNLESTMS